MPIPGDIEEKMQWPNTYGDQAPESEPVGPIRTPPTLAPVVTGMTLVGMLYAIEHWARPIFEVTGRQRRSGLLGWLLWLPAQILRFINPGVNHVAHTVSKAALHRVASPASFLNLLAWRWRQSGALLAHFAADVTYGIERIVRVKTPQAIRVRTRPLEIRVKRLRVGEIRLSLRLHTLNHWARQEFAPRVRTRLHRVERQSFRRLPLEVGKAQTTATHADELARRDHSMLRKIGWVASFAGAVPLVLYAFKRLRLNSLLCRNTRNFTEEICSSPGGTGRKAGRFLRHIFGAAFGLFVLTDICKWAGRALALVGQILDVLIPLIAKAGAALCHGEHVAAPALRVDAVTLPIPRDPLSIN